MSERDEAGAPQLHGFVDAMPAPNVLSGWVRSIVPAPGLVPIVRVIDTKTGERIGTGIVGLPRDDIGENCGYSAKVTRTVTAAELIDGRVVVIARVPRGPRWTLRVYPGLQPMARELRNLSPDFSPSAGRKGMASAWVTRRHGAI